MPKHSLGYVLPCLQLVTGLGIYSEDAEVNSVQLDIREGHAITVDKVGGAEQLDSPDPCERHRLKGSQPERIHAKVVQVTGMKNIIIFSSYRHEKLLQPDLV